MDSCNFVFLFIFMTQAFPAYWISCPAPRSASRTQKWQVKPNSRVKACKSMRVDRQTVLDIVGGAIYACRSHASRVYASARGAEVCSDDALCVIGY